MGEARRKPRADTSDMSGVALRLLTAIAQARKAAVALKDEGDDDLPGSPNDFVLMYPSGEATVATESFVRSAALLFFASRRFVPGKPEPEISRRDIPRAAALIAAMRAELRALGVVPPPQWRALAMDAASRAAGREQ